MPTWLEAGALLACLALAAYLRLANVGSTPGWFSDEGTHLDIARHLAAGQVQYLVITQSTLLFAKLPLFDLILAALVRLGDGMVVLRTFTGLLGAASAGLLYGVTRRLARGDALFALIAAAMLAIYPQAVIYHRFGFSYNLLAPLALGVLLGLAEYLERRQARWLALAAILIGVGATSDLAMLTFAAPLAIIAAAHRWRDVWWAGALVVLPLCLYAVIMLLTAPEAFLFDLSFTLSRLSALSPRAQLHNLAQNYVMLMAQDWWIAPALVGLFLIRPARLRLVALLMLLLPLVLLGRTVALYSLSTYYLIPLLPLVALGAASLVRFGAPRLVESIRGSLEMLVPPPRGESIISVISILSAAALIGTPLYMALSWGMTAVRHGVPTPIDPFLVSAADARCAADYVNANTSGDDLVIASPAVAWLIDAPAADYQMVAAASGEATPHLPGDIPASRFDLIPRWSEARYVIVDDLWRNWAAVHIPQVSGVLADLANWPLVRQCGRVDVYENRAAQQASP